MFERGRKESPEAAREVQSQQGSWTTSTDQKEPAMSSSNVNQGVAAIGRSIKINGDLQGEEDLRIEGEVNGTIRLNNNTVTVGQEGKIKADVFAKAVAVEGSVEGDLYGAEHHQRVQVRQSAGQHLLAARQPGRRGSLQRFDRDGSGSREEGPGRFETGASVDSEVG